MTVMPSLAATAWNDFVSSSPVRYRRAGSLGVHRVLKQHGYPVILAGLNRSRVQDFRAEIGQLGRLVETHRPDRTGVVYETGVVVVHAVDVGPYLYLGRLDGRSHQRRAVIAPPSAEIVDPALRVGTNETLSDEKRAVVTGDAGQCPADAFRVDLFSGILDHEVGRVQAFGLQSGFLQVGRENGRSQQLALCYDFPFGLIFLEGGRFVAYQPESCVHSRERLLLAFPEQLFYAARVFVGQHGELFLDGVPISGCRRPTDSDQRVGRPGHGRQYRDTSLLAADDLGYFFHVCGRTYRRPAELQHLNHINSIMKL